MTEKAQEERIEDLCAYLTAHRPVLTMAISPREAAERFLEAADAPRKPAWPSDKSVRASRKSAGLLECSPGDFGFEEMRKHLRAALEADPIHRAAVQLAHDWNHPQALVDIRALKKAVREAGL